MKFVYKDNPLATEVHLDEIELKLLKAQCHVEALEELTIMTDDYRFYDLIFEDVKNYKNQLFQGYQNHLVAEHCGDCTCVPASCVKCHAEEKLGISTAYNKKFGSLLSNFFYKNIDATIDDLIIYIENYDKSVTEKYGTPLDLYLEWCYEHKLRLEEQYNGSLAQLDRALDYESKG